MMLHLTLEQATQARIVAINMAAKRIENGCPASSAWDRYEEDLRLIDELMEKPQ